MNFHQEKFVRFQDWTSEKKVEPLYSPDDEIHPGKFRRTIHSVSMKFQRGLESGSERIKKSWKSYSFDGVVAKSFGSRILDPQGPFLQKWNKIFVLACLIAVSLDPLFFYIPVIDDKNKCLGLDKKMKITASVLRSFTDIFYIVHIIFQFRTGFVAPSSRVFGRGVLVEDAWSIARRYLSSYFLIDILAVLPLPQVVIIFIPKLGGSEYLNTKNLLKFIVLFQYVPRVIRIYPLYREVTRASGILTETAWAGAAFNLFLYMLASHTYLQSTTTRLEEMRVKRRDAEQWMSHRLLPENLRERIRRYEQYKWQETRGVDEENLICNLPKDLRRDIKRHLCLALLMRVPMFEKMDEQLLDAMCDRLKPVLYTEESYIVREGDPVDEMLFIMRGRLLTMTTNGGRTGFFNSEYLKAGDFCGEELLTWALDPHSSSNLPISTRTVQALSEVEAFALKADDLKFVASQFRRLHSKQLRHTFRLYSQQWRTWAACFIQAAWRRHCKKKLETSLLEEENRLQDALAKAGASSPSLGATIYASRFAANILRTIRRSGTRKARVPERLPAMLLQKPAEPDFTAEEQ
ncbi:PREDICTED: cyclic nucleotide-gated ion channel 1-like isoform X2 [Prunus mume]|uniref:Cyclic nucleotide-gated ion channel 1-like isoform X2 n=1 Tax=Prunus mume TaxID=102107 RepID=A0ABM1LRJ5_PRUMU|nr:PREDICTED: cyclic nucleotide-gated ion channel 1-like isoform X2 [Prunus mume]